MSPPDEIVEVRPRDGRRNEGKMISPPIRARLCEKLADTGLSGVEGASFVNPGRVLQMPRAKDVLAGIQRRSSITHAGFIPNER